MFTKSDTVRGSTGVAEYSVMVFLLSTIVTGGGHVRENLLAVAGMRATMVSMIKPDW